MSSTFHDDYLSAIFGAFGDTVKKVALLALAPSFGHFVGRNCHEAPAFIASVRSGGLAGLSSINFFDSSVNLALMPLHWLWTVIVGLNHLPSLLYLGVLAYGILKIWISDEEYWRGAAILLIAQPLHSWYVLCLEDRGMSRGDFASSAAIIGLYEIMAVGVAIWYAWQRDVVE
jgi:hypothetical protein